MNQTKIILDADVIIHFSKGLRLNQLPLILPDYRFFVLDIVYDELNNNYRNELDNNILFFKKIEIIKFNPIGIQQKEYAELLFKNFGRGESASMIYCKYNQDIIASSNLKDITNFCTQNGIKFITTIDLLFYGIKNNIFTIDDANTFIIEVVKKGSKLPIDLDLTRYSPICQL